jgi:hypothetical protein
MIKRFVVLLLGLGMIRVLVSPMAAKITPDDSLSVIRYKIKQSGIHRNEIARELNLSISTVNKNLSGNTDLKLHQIIKYANKRIM